MSVKMKTPSVKMKASSAMKDSGIDWIGEIPEHWDVMPIRFLFTENRVKNTMKQEKLALKFTYGTIVPKENFDADNDEYVSATISNYTVVKPGVIMINCLNLNYDFVSQRIGLVKDNGAITSAYLAISPKNKLDSEFVTYQLKYWDSVKAFHNMGTGVRKTLNFDELGKKYFPHPPIEEQRLIAVQLNQICGTLDNTKADIEKQIEILNEYKKSVITEAVTKGLDKNVELKDSGIDWIGEVPEHWDIEKIKYIFERYEKKNYPDKEVLSVYREYGVIPKNSRDDNHNVTSEDTSNYKYVKPGYLVINKMKAWQGSMGISEYEGIVSPAYFIYRFRKDSYHKYYHFLLRNCYKDEFRRISGGIREGQWDLSAYDFENTLIPIPPINEQQEIVAYLDSKCSEIDSIIETKKHQLELLEEYKKSIIYEYVTGKREVSAPIDEVTAPIDEVSAKPDFAVAQNTQSVSIE